MSPVFWLFGRSGAGKTTLGDRLRRRLAESGRPVFFLDGDEARAGLSSDLGFGKIARVEHHRRLAEVARLVSDQDILPVVATMAPEHSQRDLVNSILGPRLTWVFIDATFDECVRRDPKGLYRRAREGTVANLLDYPFDDPREHERALHIGTGHGDVQSSVDELTRGVLSRLDGERD